jgi:hypothetical protein
MLLITPILKYSLRSHSQLRVSDCDITTMPLNPFVNHPDTMYLSVVFFCEAGMPIGLPTDWALTKDDECLRYSLEPDSRLCLTLHILFKVHDYLRTELFGLSEISSEKFGVVLAII